MHPSLDLEVKGWFVRGVERLVAMWFIWQEIDFFNTVALTVIDTIEPLQSIIFAIPASLTDMIPEAIRPSANSPAGMVVVDSRPREKKPDVVSTKA